MAKPKPGAAPEEASSMNLLASDGTVRVFTLFGHIPLGKSYAARQIAALDANTKDFEPELDYPTSQERHDHGAQILADDVSEAVGYLSENSLFKEYMFPGYATEQPMMYPAESDSSVETRFSRMTGMSVLQQAYGQTESASITSSSDFVTVTESGNTPVGAVSNVAIDDVLVSIPVSDASIVVSLCSVADLACESFMGDVEDNYSGSDLSG